MTVMKMYNAARDALLAKRGAAMVEYALLAGLIAVVAIATLQTLGSNVNGAFAVIATKI